MFNFSSWFLANTEKNPVHCADTFEQSVIPKESWMCTYSALLPVSHFEFNKTIQKRIVLSWFSHRHQHLL